MTAIVGLYSPWPQSGKSTVAKELKKNRSGAVLSFANDMRFVVVEFVADFLDGGEEEAWEWLSDKRKDTKLVPELGVTMRHMLQTIGTEWGRNCIHPDIWVKKARKRLRGCIASYGKRAPDLMIFDDVRFENEHAMLRKEGATLIRVYRPGTRPEKQHESNERLESLPFDYVITNDRSKAKLKERVAEIAEGILG